MIMVYGSNLICDKDTFHITSYYIIYLLYARCADCCIKSLIAKGHKLLDVLLLQSILSYY